MKKPLILIADDDSAIRLVLEKKFNRSGFTTKSTNKGKTLLSWIQSGEGDLIITDVIMEDSNGLDLLPLIQKVRPDLPVLVMSGLNTIKTAIDASAGGAYEYFPKPFDLDKVLDVVVKAFNSPPTESNLERIWKAFLLLVPLKITCSKKWAIPISPSDSSLEPTFINTPICPTFENVF